MSATSLALALLALGVLASASVGIVAGLAAMRRIPRSLLAAFAAGALLFLLFDLMKESAGLGQGVVDGNALRLTLVACFAAGALVAPLLPAAPLAWMWTAGIALHGMGEGWVLGSEDAQSQEILRIPGALSFLLHKGIEAFTVPVLAGAFAARRGAALAAALALSALVAALAAGTPALPLPTATPLMLFAAGAGATTWATIRVAKLADVDARHVAALVAGALAVYAAGLLHEV